MLRGLQPHHCKILQVCLTFSRKKEKEKKSGVERTKINTLQVLDHLNFRTWIAMHMETNQVKIAAHRATQFGAHARRCINVNPPPQPKYIASNEDKLRCWLQR